jgi:hypothetical protein
MSFPPWREMKQQEMLILYTMREGREVTLTEIENLRSLFTQCAKMEDAAEAICYHGAAAILAVADGDENKAIRHREIEIRKIKELHVEEQRNPTGGYATQNYGNDDLQFRIELLDKLANAG